MLTSFSRISDTDPDRLRDNDLDFVSRRFDLNGLGSLAPVCETSVEIVAIEELDDPEADLGLFLLAPFTTDSSVTADLPSSGAS